MTIEKLLQMSASDIERMSDAELEKHFAGYFKVTRPELAEKPKKAGSVGGSRRQRGGSTAQDDPFTAVYKVQANMEKMMAALAAGDTDAAKKALGNKR